MILDKTTLKDLHLLGAPGQDLFSRVDRCVTQKGREVLRAHWLSPPADAASLKAFQEGIRFWAESEHRFPKSITNGTLVMIDQFYQSGDWISRGRSSLEIRLISAFRRLFSPRRESPQFFYLSHFRDLVLGAEALVSESGSRPLPALIEGEFNKIREALDHPGVAALRELSPRTGLRTLSEWSRSLRTGMKSRFEQLIKAIARLDAWMSMGRATREEGWVFPQWGDGEQLVAEGLYHPLLEQPVTYGFPYWAAHRFVFLTGANMSGKTTLMRSLGVAAYLAHLGMGVPARSMTTPFLDFMMTNMAVEDDLLKGESLFFAEVQRIKGVAHQLNQGRRGMILLDELFKGTNVVDAHACTSAIVEALAGYDQHWILLSSHLFEVAREMAGDPRIRFASMVTEMLPDGGYRFSYQLRDGISRDQIGYRILVREGVLEALRPRGKPGGC